MAHERSESRDSGFTLLELLVVMIVIGILAAIAVPTFLSQRQRARDLTLKGDMHNLFLEMTTQWTDNNGVYPLPRELQLAGVAFKTSPTVTLTVVWAAADDFCMIGTSSASGPDRSGVGGYVGVPTRMFVRSSTTRPTEVTATRLGCLADRPASAANGFFTPTGYRETL